MEAARTILGEIDHGNRERHPDVHATQKTSTPAQHRSRDRQRDVHERRRDAYWDTHDSITVPGIGNGLTSAAKTWLSADEHEDRESVGDHGAVVTLGDDRSPRIRRPRLDVAASQLHVVDRPAGQPPTVAGNRRHGLRDDQRPAVLTSARTGRVRSVVAGGVSVTAARARRAWTRSPGSISTRRRRAPGAARPRGYVSTVAVEPASR